MPRLSITLGLDDAATAAAKVASNTIKSSFDNMAGAVTAPMKGLGDVLGNITTIALGTGILSLPGKLLDAAKAAGEDAASVDKLAKAVENAGADFGAYSSTLDDVIAKGMRLGFSDSAQRDSLALLTAQTKSVDEAMRRQVIAMDFARGANIDLSTASKLLGKVTDENVGVLSRYGIVMEKGATESELFAEVQRRFGGQAEAFGRSQAGAYAAIKLKLDDMVEVVGTALLPVLSALTSFAADTLLPLFESHLVPVITDISARITQLAGGLGIAIDFFSGAEGAGLAFHNALERLVGVDAANFLIKIAETVRTLIEYFKAIGPEGEYLNRVLDNLPKPLAAVAASVGLVVSAVSAAITAFGTGGLGAALSTFGEQMRLGLETIVPMVLSVFKDIAKEFVAWVEPTAKELLAQFPPLRDALLAEVARVLPPLIHQLEQWANEFGAWVVPAVEQFLKEWPAMLDTFLDKLDAALPPIIAVLAKWAGEFVEWIAPAIPKIVLALVGISVAILFFLAETARIIGTHIVTKWAPALWEWVKDPVIPELLRTLPKIQTAIMNWVIEVGGKVFEEGKKVGGALMRGMVAAISAVSIPLPTFSIGYTSIPTPAGNISVPNINIGTQWRTIGSLSPQGAQAAVQAFGGAQSGIKTVSQTVNITVLGSIVQERDLVASLRNELLVVADRNINSGL